LKRFVSGIFNRYDRGIWIRVLGSALTTTTGFMIRPFLALYLFDRLEGSILLPMLVIGLQPLCGMIVMWYGGGLSDRYGRKPLMLAALLLQMCCMAGYVFATEVWHFAAISVLNGIGFALFMPASDAQMTDMVEPDRRAEVFALKHTAFNVGAALGPTIGLLMFKWNAPVVFLLSAGTFLLNALLVHFALPETAPRKDGIWVDKPKAIRPRISWREHKPLLLLTLYSLPIWVLYAQVETTFPLHLKTHFEHFTTVLASLLTFNGMMVIALQIWIARKTENAAPHLALGFSSLLFAVVAIGYGFSHWVVLLFVVEFIFTIGEMICGPHAQKVISLLAPAEQRGFYFSVYGGSGMLARGIGPIVGGLLFEHFGGEAMFVVWAALIFAAGYAQMQAVRKMAAVYA
jgi:MFS family permease